MATDVLQDVLEATGYLENGAPAHGVHLGDDARSRCRSRNFAPDALWRSNSALTVYFKHAQEAPSDEQVADWRREIWNQGFAGAPSTATCSPRSARPSRTLNTSAGSLISSTPSIRNPAR